MARLEVQRISRRIGSLEARRRDHLVNADLPDPRDFDTRAWRDGHRRHARVLERHIDLEAAQLRELLERIGTTSPTTTEGGHRP